jgi:hypothetical protein
MPRDADGGDGDGEESGEQLQRGGLHCVATRCTVLQQTTVLHPAGVCCNALYRVASRMRHGAGRRGRDAEQQHGAMRCGCEACCEAPESARGQTGRRTARPERTPTTAPPTLTAAAHAP